MLSPLYFFEFFDADFKLVDLIGIIMFDAVEDHECVSSDNLIFQLTLN